MPVDKAGGSTSTVMLGAALNAAGQHGAFNRMLLAGAMEGEKRKPTIDDSLETYLFQSNTVFASFSV